MNFRLSQELEAKTLLALPPEDLAGFLLAKFKALPVRSHELHMGNFVNEVMRDDGYPQPIRQLAAEAVCEAWSWLEHEGLLRPRPGSPGWCDVSRRGRQIEGKEGFETYRRGKLLPTHLLHTAIAEKVTAPFLRGEYDTCVFIAFREVEVTVRAAGQFADTDLGVSLMEEAFKPHAGPLANTSEPEPEQLAIRKLFAGAIGYYKNPGSHRNVVVEADEAVELICLASRLIKIADARKTT